MPSHEHVRSLRSLCCAAIVLLASSAQAWIHDRNQDKIDDRIARVKADGFTAAFENSKASERMIIGVFASTPVRYSRMTFGGRRWYFRAQLGSPLT